jgi:predicted dehydrogenase
MGAFRVGLIGAGKHGARYIRHIREDCPAVDIVAVSRRDPVKLRATAEELGVEAFSSYQALIASRGLDAVIAVVPPTMHLDIVREAARAGLPVLLEKPAAPNLGQGREMLAVLEEHPVPVMVAQTLRYNGIVRRLVDELESIGTIHAITLSQRFERSPLAWLDEPSVSGGGITLHTGVHLFDLLRVLSGCETVRVTCQTQSIHTKHTEDSFAATAWVGEGQALATVSCARTAPGRGGHIELAGEKGTLVADHVLRYAKRVVGAKSEDLDVGPPVATVQRVVEDFVDAVRGGKPMPVPLVEGLRAVAAVDACYAAAASGRVTEVEPLRDGDEPIFPTRRGSPPVT